MIRTADQEERAFQLLRQAILTGEFGEGDPVPEARLARKWKLGRTPLRQGVRRAAALGYITLRPNQAPIVRRLTAEDVEQIYSFREELECLALKMAWKSIPSSDVTTVEELAKTVETAQSTSKRLEKQFALDEAIHELWISRCYNTWLVEALERLFVYRPNQTAILRSHPQLAEAGFEDHLKLLDSIKQRDLKKTTARLRSHIKRAGQGLARFVRQTAIT